MCVCVCVCVLFCFALFWFGDFFCVSFVHLCPPPIMKKRNSTREGEHIWHLDTHLLSLLFSSVTRNGEIDCKIVLKMFEPASMCRAYAHAYALRDLWYFRLLELVGRELVSNGDNYQLSLWRRYVVWNRKWQTSRVVYASYTVWNRKWQISRVVYASYTVWNRKWHTSSCLC